MAKRGGARKGAGRKSGIGVTNDIQRFCFKFICELLENERIRAKAISQLRLYESPKDDCIYLIKNNDKYKIGYSGNFNKRYKVYKSHLGEFDVVLFYTTAKAFEIESEFHEKFKDKAITVEWYKFTDLELIEVIKYITEKVYKNGWSQE